MVGWSDKISIGPASSMDDGGPVYETSVLKCYALKIHMAATDILSIEETCRGPVEGAMSVDGIVSLLVEAEVSILDGSIAKARSR